MLSIVWRWGVVVAAMEGVRQLSGLSIAHAGAWTHERDAGYSSLDMQRESSEFGSAWRSESYLEFGATDRLTVVTKAETLQRDQDGGEDRLAGLVAVRREFVQVEGLVLSGQLGTLFGESLEGPVCEGVGVESRIMAGWSGATGGRNVWLNAETGFRNQGGCGRWKTDLAAGLDLNDDWRTQAKAYWQSGDGPRSLKVEAGIARRMGEQFIGVSYRREIGGAFEEEGWILSLSRSF